MKPTSKTISSPSSRPPSLFSISNRDFQAPGRSAVMATNGMAATSHPLATSAAVNVLRNGGNAMDAAVTAAALLGVVEPQMTGIGGDCFVILAQPGKEPVAYNGSGRAPAALSADLLVDNGFTGIPQNSAHAVTIPGAIEAWATLLGDYGRFGLDAALSPAIDAAQNGTPVTPRVAFDWAGLLDVVAGYPASAALYLPQGAPPQAGELFRNPALAEAMRDIAGNGPDAFYKGWIAEDMLNTLQGLGGLHEAADFASHKGAYVTPIRTTYRGVDILECPPNGQGLTALMGLNILSGFELADAAPLGAMRLHLQAEAMRLAYADRDAMIADPERADVPVEGLLSPSYAAHQRRRIDPAQAMIEPQPLNWPIHKDTVYLCVVDSDGMAVSFINSIFSGFGSGITAPKSGVTLQNRGAGFTLEADHPNRLEGGKRPFHTIIPAMAMQNGRAIMPFGVMGGQYQAVGHVHLLVNMLDLGMDVQSALDLPRAFHYKGVYELESGIPQATAKALTSLGHAVKRAKKPIGGGQAITIDWQRGVLTGGSDPRKDGCALGY